MLNSEGCSKMGLLLSRWVVESSLSVHAWSLTVATVVSVIIATIVVVVVLLPLVLTLLSVRA